MNSVHLIGTVKYEPKLNTFNSGKAKTSVLIETPPADGQQYPDNAEVVGWEDVAMALADLREGDAVEIHGRIRTESWADKSDPTGKKKIYKMVVLASSVASPSRTVRAASATAKAAGKFGGLVPLPAEDDDIPF